MSNKYKEYLTDKRIIIVGPSPYLLNDEQKDLIDSFDIVCRIKKSYPVPTKLKIKLGTRTDILISHLKLNGYGYNQNNFKIYDNYVFNRLKYILFPYPKADNYNSFYREYQLNCKDIKTPIICQNDKTKLDELKLELNGYSPTTGLAGIVDLLSYPIKELHIIGMTFQNDGFCEYYKTPIENTKRVNATKNYHNMKNEMIVFKKLLEKDDRIKIDSTLQKIMEKVDITEELNKPRPKPPTMREKIEMMKTKNKKKIKNMGKKKVKKKKKTKE